MTDDYDWNDCEADRVVNSASEVVIYLNTQDDVVLRQRADPMVERDDPTIILPIDRIPAIIRRLTMMLKEANHESVTVIDPSVVPEGTTGHVVQVPAEKD